jgi:hypothetical protein
MNERTDEGEIDSIHILVNDTIYSGGEAEAKWHWEARGVTATTAILLCHFSKETSAIFFPLRTILQGTKCAHGILYRYGDAVCMARVMLTCAPTIIIRARKTAVVQVVSLQVSQKRTDSSSLSNGK